MGGVLSTYYGLILRSREYYGYGRYRWNSRGTVKMRGKYRHVGGWRGSDINYRRGRRRIVDDLRSVRSQVVHGMVKMVDCLGAIS